MRAFSICIAIGLAGIGCASETPRVADQGLGDVGQATDAPSTAFDSRPQDARQPRIDGQIPDAPVASYTCAGNLSVGAGKAHQTIAAALAAAKAGDTIVVADGTHDGSVTVSKGGTAAGKRLTICAAHRRRAILRSSSGVLTLRAPWLTVKGFVLDGKWGKKDIVRVSDAADNLLLTDLEIKNGTADGIDIGGGSAGGAESIRIEHTTVHHMLAGSTANQLDAHCIVATDFRNLAIVHTEAGRPGLMWSRGPQRARRGRGLAPLLAMDRREPNSRRDCSSAVDREPHRASLGDVSAAGHRRGGWISRL